jgi:hypothetical protein
MTCAHGWMMGSAEVMRPPCPACRAEAFAAQDRTIAELRAENEGLRSELAQVKKWHANALMALHDPENYYNRPEWCVPVLICSAHRHGCPPICSVRIGYERSRYENEIAKPEG